MRFAVDAWEPDYSSDTGAPVEVAKATVDASVEVAAPQWAPRRPGPVGHPASVAFVDGVRRTEARIWIDRPDGTSAAGVCASVGAGLVSVEDGAAHLDVVTVRRVIASAPDVVAAVDTAAGRFEPVAVVGDGNEALMLGVQNAMAVLESDLAVASGAELTVVDGPLRDAYRLAGAIGLVKTHHTSYLPPDLEPVVSALGDGERTPLFVVRGPRSFWSWYLRLPGPRSHRRAGIVRLEAALSHELAAAVGLADVSAALLPRFASQPHKDQRAPQNLVPIGGLERGVRHRLGDPTLVRRALRQAAALSAPADPTTTGS